MGTGLSLIDTSTYTPTVPTCRTEKDCYSCNVQPCAYAVKTHEAVRLIQAGARTSTVIQLTKLPKKYVKRIYFELRGEPSPRGKTIRTDAWFRESEHRMLHASAVWRIHNLVAPLGRSKTRVLLDVNDIYLSFTKKPLLDLTHIEAVLTLVAISVWEAKHCDYCKKLYLTSADENLGSSCPGCRIYHRFRCCKCGEALTIYTLGRPRSCCENCSTQGSK